jgi:nitrate/TMAO reductase-like tetraheme cytochrome c subunit
MDVHGGELGSECENCHSPKTWENRQEIFDEHSDTRFPLVGVHGIIDCESCHFQQTPHEYKTTPIECYQCHLDEYQSSKNPDHIEAQFSTDCQTCHPIHATTWSQTVYSHPQSYPLFGAHIQVDCLGCHSTGYFGTPNLCEDCHIQDYQAASDPDHKVFGFPTNCEICHNENQWGGTSFDHLAESGFALNGAHATILCNSCHVNNQVSGLPRDCIRCHEGDYNSVDDPNHVQAQFSFDCLECHSEQSWTPATFDHSKTNFPLTGTHLTISCIDCHTNGQYTGTPTDCISCHETDYNNSTDPNHQAAGYPVQCENCHNTTNWDDADWDHNQTQFPLTGAHVTISCIDCHKNDQYTGLPGDCYSCHDNDYNATSDPNHQSAGFPVQCEDCHNTNNWEETTWDHDAQYFPIYTGKHREAWDNCVDCHLNPGDYGAFECILCHEHSDQADLADKHDEEQDYEYESQACYSCHPTGTADD